MDSEDSERARELVLAISLGNRLAESELVERFGLRLKKYLYSRIEPELRDDVCQQTLLITIEKLRAGKILEPEKLYAFTMGIAKNLVKTYRREQRKYLSLDELDQLRTESNSPQERTHQQELSCKVKEAMESLDNSRYKQLLIRYYLLEEDSLSICKDLNISEQAFHTALCRARKRVKELLKKL